MARFLDILAVLLLNVVVNGYFAYEFARGVRADLAGRDGQPIREQPQPTARMETLLWTMLIVATLLWLLYEAPATGSRGQTLGKRIMHIKVFALENTEPLGFGRAFRRWARLGAVDAALGAAPGWDSCCSSSTRRRRCSTRICGRRCMTRPRVRLWSRCHRTTGRPSAPRPVAVPQAPQIPPEA
jgi:uncharacterized RDD family membrane protein YckC